MKIFELISYKTAYYFVSNTSNLNLSQYDLKENLLTQAETVYKEDDVGYLYNLFGDYLYPESNYILEIKTINGSFIFHKGDNHDYVKNFLKVNSKDAPCAYFSSFRISDDYIFAYAKNGEIQRYICNSEEGSFIEGNITEAERKCGLNYSMDEDDCFITPYVHEDDIVNIAKQIIPFDIEKDIKILAINLYQKNKNKIAYTDKNITTTLSPEIILNIHNNLKKQDRISAGISVLKKKKSDKAYILCIDFKNDNPLYADIINIKNKEEFINSITKCLNVLSSADFEKKQEHISRLEQIANAIKYGKSIKTVAITTNTKYYNTLTISKISNIPLLPAKLQAILLSPFNLKSFKNFIPHNLSNIYDFCLKKLK